MVHDVKVHELSKLVEVVVFVLKVECAKVCSFAKHFKVVKLSAFSDCNETKDYKN